MSKRFLTVGVIASLLVCAYYGAEARSKSSEADKKKERMEEIMKNLPDSVFENVDIEDLLDDEVYLKLAKDGWTPREITAIMETAVKDKSKARRRDSYGAYAKEWRPAFGRTMNDDPLYQFVTPELSTQAIASIHDAVGTTNYNATWEKIPYDPTLRKQTGYQPSPGYFKPVELNPSSGRIKWIAIDQNDDKGDNLYVSADGAGIFRTRDCGESWVCITDNIEDRANRGISAEYALPVDPDDFNHLFAFMQNNSVYETFDGGDTWERVPGATYNGKTFKRGYAFRAKPTGSQEQGDLILIGAAMNNSNRMKNELWISYNKGVTWQQITVPANLAEQVFISGATNTGFWFQQMAFDPKDRDVVYFPGSQSILYFDDAGRSGTLKRLTFDVYGADKSGEPRVKNATRFPFPGNAAGHMEIDPNNPDRMWYTVGNSTYNYTALYYSDDHGKTWITLHEPHDNDNYNSANPNFKTEKYIGSGTVFGNETANTWLGGFGVRYNSDDPDAVPQEFFGCSMSSAYSFDGGHNWTEYTWTARQRSFIKNTDNPAKGEGYYYVSASRHNADNHCIASHKSGRVFRGSDGGMFMNDPTISNGQTVAYNDNGTGSTGVIQKQDWVNISSKMGQMLFYDVRTNEFGDYAIIGNSQDIDVQTYRYGRWGNWRGYEGSEASFNPYTGTGYFSSGGNAPDGMNPSSWHTARNYADVVTGSWFMLRTWSGSVSPSTLYRVDDVGRSLTDLYDAIGKTVTDVGLCRDKGRLTVFVRTSGDNAYWMSTDSCKTFQGLRAYNGNVAAFSNSHLAVDPECSDYFYFGQNGGKVYKYTISDGKWTAVGSGLPNVTCSRLLFHEGSGDLYYIDYNTGIYILKNGESTWRYWTRGYNTASFRDCDINYTSQEMVICDYGRGVYVADLETPSDRYFKKGFRLKEISHRDGRRVFGIDTQWTIPMYYNYKWFVNGQEVKNPYQYLNVPEDGVNEVQLQLSLREAPYVTTTSAVLQVTPTESVPIERHQGNGLYSNGMGRVDIGYMDWFYDDFSVDLWVKPRGDGVILANSQKDVEKGAKGWLLYIDGGVLKFKYYPSNLIQQPTYEPAIVQNPVISGAAIAMNKWSHVAVTQQRHGNICLYINGEKVAEQARVRDTEPHTLNNSVIMSLFGDAFESSTLDGAVDELKFWKKALDNNEVRREMFSTDLAESGDMVAHYDFNGEKLDENTETYTGYKPVSRTRAVTSPVRQTVPLSANYVAHKDMGEGKTDFISTDRNIEMPLMSIEGDNLSGVHAVVYGYDGGRWENSDDNLSEEYYTPTQYGYMLRTFGAIAPENKAKVTFYNGNDNFDNTKNYRLYMADNSEDRMYWKQFTGNIKANSDGTITLNDVALNDISDRKLMLVTMKPAIEMSIEGLSSDGRIVLYDDGEDKTSFPFTARLIENKTVANNRYEIMSDSAVIRLPETPLSFDDRGEAHGNMHVDTDLIGPFNNTISTFIRGKNDDQMIPIPVDILNRISPLTLNDGVQIAKGCMRFGTAADFAAMKGSNHFTIMGWVRIDDIAAIKAGRNNNDGVSPLLFFRSASGNGNATGIHLREGNLGYHWNDAGWNYNAKTPAEFTFTQDYQGKWVHLALVVAPEGAWMYFNGMEYKMTGTQNPMPLCNAESPLLLGTNTQGNYTYFSGAMDHIAVWNRSLSREEIHKYMHNRVLLNDPELLAYITMDEKDNANRYKESVKGMTAATYGTISNAGSTPVPFAPNRQDVSMAESGCPISLSSTTAGCVASFEGTPYNYIPSGTEYQAYLPLNHEFYTLIYNALPSATGNVTLTYSFDGLVDDEEIAVGIRELGSVTPFDSYIVASSVKDGKATFTVPASKIAKSSEIMFFSTPSSSHRPTIVRMAFSNPKVADGDIYLLDDGENEIDVDVNVVSGDTPVVINAVEDYVTLSKHDIDMNRAEQKVTLTINKDKLREINKFGLSDVTLNLTGTTSEPLTLKVGLKPRVELSLKNGGDATHFTAREAVSTLDIEAELIEGYLAENIELGVTPETLSSALSISNGSLLLNDPVTVGDLKFVTSQTGQQNQGWNLIGNPYLTEINLTKHQNYDYKDKSLTHFVYHTLDGTNNVLAYDMTDFDDRQHIHPFQSYYVQAMTDNTDFTVTDVAKEKSVSRKTLDYYTADEVRAVTLSLYDADGNEEDRTTVRWDKAANVNYVLDEDAVKVNGANQYLSNSLYTADENHVRMSINFVPEKTKQYIPLNIDVAKPGEMTLKVSRFSGFDNKENNLYLVDTDGWEKKFDLTDGTEFTFTAPSEGTLEGRFFIVPTFNGDILTDVNDLDTDGDDIHQYRVYTDKRSCTVTGLRGDAIVGIYNTAGMLIVSAETNEPTFTATDLDAGAYVVTIRENDKDYSTKIVVR